MRIYVSANDIKLGLKTLTSSTKCPVARAIRKAGLKGVYVGVGYARMENGGEIKLPSKATGAIQNMCNQHSMEPFSFTLNKKHIEILKGK